MRVFRLLVMVVCLAVVSTAGSSCSNKTTQCVEAYDCLASEVCYKGRCVPAELVPDPADQLPPLPPIGQEEAGNSLPDESSHPLPGPDLAQNNGPEKSSSTGVVSSSPPSMTFDAGGNSSPDQYTPPPPPPPPPDHVPGPEPFIPGPEPQSGPEPFVPGPEPQSGPEPFVPGPEPQAGPEPAPPSSYPPGPYGTETGGILKPLAFDNCDKTSKTDLRNYYQHSKIKVLLLSVHAGW